MIAARSIGEWIVRHWLWVVSGWLALLAGLSMLAPPWESVTRDGDLAFLPSESRSQLGQRRLEAGFADHLARSQLVLCFARSADTPLTEIDRLLGLDIATRLLHRLAAQHWRRWLSHGDASWQIAARDALDQAAELEGAWFELAQQHLPAGSPLLASRYWIVYAHRSYVLENLGDLDSAEVDREMTLALADAAVPWAGLQAWYEPLVVGGLSPLLDVWTWRDPILGSKLGQGHPQARLLYLQLESEFLAAVNLSLVAEIERLIAERAVLYQPYTLPGWRWERAGSAAVGVDMLNATRASLRQTEWVTVAMVLFILSWIYRSPLLVAVPLLSIGMSLAISTRLLALLAVDPLSDGAAWGLELYSTTRIFIVVLLFGAGTDFCLFLISRFQEELQKLTVGERGGEPTRVGGAWMRGTDRRRARQAGAAAHQVRQGVASAWEGVYLALLGSGLTTIVGLSLMGLAEFRKLSHSGPTIGIALAVTVAISLTWTPALLAGLGSWLLWPRRPPVGNSPGNTAKAHRGWIWLAELVIRRPGSVLLATLAVLAIPAGWGWWYGDRVTYDFPRELSFEAPSRRGSRLVAEQFGGHDVGGLTVLVARQEAFDDPQSLRSWVESLRGELYVPGVVAVRGATDPLGSFRPGRPMGIFDQQSWRRRLLANHGSVQRVYLASNAPWEGRLVRFDLVLELDPFALEAAEVMELLVDRLEPLTADPASAWSGCQVDFAGIVAGLDDLRRVTQADQRRIQWDVIGGVWLVLTVLLRRFWLSGYLVATVLLSYFTTLGVTHAICSWSYGDDFLGLDWKVSLFLFVILVAVGQDYNVYLTSRVLEEQRRHGRLPGIARGLVMTGGIITSCGLVMAATFGSMATSPLINTVAGAWGWWPDGPLSRPPVLRGVVELGLALGLGVLIDTLIVRSLLVPSMMAWVARRSTVSSMGVSSSGRNSVEST
jgi:putative drug exporter of the RND superfamily